MAKKPKVRVTISVDNKPRQLFSVQEAAGGDLLVIPAAGTSHRLDAFKNPLKDTREVHISVHSSPKSEANTVVTTILAVDGSRRRMSALVRPRPHGLVFVLWGQRFQTLADDQFIVRIRPKDKHVSLGKYDPTANTLVLFVCVNGKPNKHIPLPVRDFTMTTFTVGEYSIVVFHSFMHVGSLPVNHLYQFATSSATQDGKKVHDNRPSFVAEAMKDSDVVDLIEFITNSFSESYLEHLQEYAKQSGHELTIPQLLVWRSAAYTRSSVPRVLKEQK
jgi:hypothetical protein